MISVTSAQLSAWIALFIFPFVRILAMIATAPVFGNKQLSARVKIGLAALITFLIAPNLPPLPPDFEPASAAGLMTLVMQILAGVIMGFILRGIFIAIQMAGELIGMQMGLGFASFYDPVNAATTPVVGQFLQIIATLMFLALDGHLYMLAALAGSFQAFPISTTPPHANAMYTVALWGGTLFSDALQFAMPAIAALLATNMVLAILTRSAPQLNIFSIGFPITLVIGFVVLLLLVTYLAPAVDQLMRNNLDTISRILHQMGQSAQ